MATTYTWDIENVDLISSHNGNENIVFRVTWKCTADDGEGNSKYQIGVVELDPNIDPESFLSIDTVTKQNIIDWVKGTVSVSVIERDLMPNVTTITFAGTDTTTSTTVAEALASTIASRSETPDPNNT